jgi:hypothetical protein
MFCNPYANRRSNEASWTVLKKPHLTPSSVRIALELILDYSTLRPWHAVLFALDPRPATRPGMASAYKPRFFPILIENRILAMLQVKQPEEMAGEAFWIKCDDFARAARSWQVGGRR